MVNTLYLIAISLCVVGASICTIITDFKHGKILNRHIFLFLKIGITIQLIYFIYVFLCQKYFFILEYYIINCFIGTFISIIFYHFDIWGAGDSKYIILMLLISPVNIIENTNIIAFQGLMIFIITFSVAFIYLILESVYLRMKESPVLEKESYLNLSFIKSFLIKWLFSFSVITIIYKTINIISSDFLVHNIILIRIFTILFMFYFMEKVKNKRIYISVVFLGLAMMILDNYLNTKVNNIIVDYKMIFSIFVVIVLRNLCSKYNYKKIKTSDVKEGMILSAGTFIGFVNSRVKGLPDFKSESIHSKINSEEAESIKRWGKSKYGQEYIYIVRQIPFAPFISIGALGSMIYFIL